MIKTYKFKSTRIWIFIPILFILIVSVSIIFSDLLKPYEGFLGFLLFLIQVVISFIFSWAISTIKIEVIIDESKIKIRKLKGILPYETKEFEYDEINEYKYTPDRNFDTLKIKLKNRKTIRLVRLDTIINRDVEFNKFVNKFTIIVNKLNDENKTEIYRVLNFYETKQGIYIAYIFAICIVILTVSLFFIPNTMNKAGAIIAIMGGSFYILQVFHFRRKKK
ncbi:MAG: hypothetical protein AB7S50_13075 [Bacteroidales bacterium]